MPIHVGADIKRMDGDEFKARVYEVMRHVFDVQRELGRLFHEKIYHREIAFRIPDSRCEVALDVQFEDFCKTYLEASAGSHRPPRHSMDNIARPVVRFNTLWKGKKGR